MPAASCWSPRVADAAVAIEVVVAMLRVLPRLLGRGDGAVDAAAASSAAAVALAAGGRGAGGAGCGAIILRCWGVWCAMGAGCTRTPAAAAGGVTATVSAGDADVDKTAVAARWLSAVATTDPVIGVVAASVRLLGAVAAASCSCCSIAANTAAATC